MERMGRSSEPEHTNTLSGVLPDAEETAWLDREIEKAISRIHIPEPAPVTSEELERRREVFARLTRLRDEIGPLSVSASELIRELRGWPGEERPLHS